MTDIFGDFFPEFAPLADAFKSLFRDYAEVGAGVALWYDGELVVDLWAGSRDRAREVPWQEETRSNIFSAGKALVALSCLQLVADGTLELDAPIANLWPEFGGEGKSTMTLRQVLCHRSGLSAFHPKVDDAAIYDWEQITRLIAAESPWWEPNSDQGYSPMIFGWLLGEVVRRASGCTDFREYLETHINQPLGTRFGCGLSDNEIAEVADMEPIRRIQQVEETPLSSLMKADPRGVVNRAFANPATLMTGTNGQRWRQAQIPAANIHASARDLAIFYGSLADSSDERLLGSENHDWCWQEQSRGEDRVLGNPLQFSLGFMTLPPAGITEGPVFSHPGAGGSLGFADPKKGLGFGFVSRAMGQAILYDERVRHLLRAIYGVI